MFEVISALPGHWDISGTFWTVHLKRLLKFFFSMIYILYSFPSPVLWIILCGMMHNGSNYLQLLLCKYAQNSFQGFKKILELFFIVQIKTNKKIPMKNLSTNFIRLGKRGLNYLRIGKRSIPRGGFRALRYQNTVFILIYENREVGSQILFP